MNRADVIKCISKIRIAYPNKKYYETKEDLASLIDLWLEVFAPFKAEAMNKAVINAIARCDFPPTISSINSCLNDLMDEHRITINSTRDSIKHWEMMADMSKGEEKERYEKYLEEYRQTLKRLEEYEFFD